MLRLVHDIDDARADLIESLAEHWQSEPELPRFRDSVLGVWDAVRDLAVRAIEGDGFFILLGATLAFDVGVLIYLVQR